MAPISARVSSSLSSFRFFRNFIGVVYTGKTLNFTGSGFGVQSLAVTGLAYLNGCIDMDFDKSTVLFDWMVMMGAFGLSALQRKPVPIILSGGLNVCFIPKIA